MKSVKKLAWGVACVCASLAWSSQAWAFCGTYVSGGDADLFNGATQVVLMRGGTKTVLSMQNDYQGPIKDFAMVVPVPVVLEPDDVKTLPREVFADVDAMGAPRLVAYDQQDPCDEFRFPCLFCSDDAPVPLATSRNEGNNSGWDGQVTVEAEFEVGEYDISVLSATQATGLMSWLDGNGYAVSDDAADVLQGYITQGMYFFVAKVDPAEVTFDSSGRAVLSPLRFEYDSAEFALPVRLGMLNAKDEQDLIVSILSDNQRYEVANYPNVTIPTNLEVDSSVVAEFGAFYSALFERTVSENPGAVVTEYSWQASKCDPCPPTSAGGFGGLTQEDIATLGGDVVGQGSVFNWTLTRLHARYAKGSLGEDLIFKTAGAIVGGRQVARDGALEKGASTSDLGFNQFQGRYIMRNYWTGPVSCSNPDWDRWGPAGSGASVAVGPTSGGSTEASSDELEFMVREDVAALGLDMMNPPPEPGELASGCGCAAPGSGAVPAGGLALFVFGVFGLRRARSRR